MFVSPPHQLAHVLCKQAFSRWGPAAAGGWSGAGRPLLLRGSGAGRPLLLDAPLSSHPHRRAQAHPKQLQGSSSLTPPQNMFFLLLFSHCNILVVQMNQMKLWKISVRLQIHRNGFGHMRVYCFSQIPHDCCGLPSTTCKQETESKDRCTASVTAAAFLLQGPTWLSAVTTMPW